MKVLLVVDVQNDFCPGGALAVPEGDKVVSIINDLIKNGDYDAIVATKDWHPAAHKSFAVNHEGAALFSSITLNGLPQVLWPAHCVQGSPGAEFHPLLDSSRFDAVVEKGTNVEVDSYSGFFDNARRHETDLKKILTALAEENGIIPESLVVDVCGLATDYCVKATALDAKSLGFFCRVIVDACRAVNLNPGDDVVALRELRDRFIDLIESREILGQREIPKSVEVGPAVRPIAMQL